VSNIAQDALLLSLLRVPCWTGVFFNSEKLSFEKGKFWL